MLDKSPWGTVFNKGVERLSGVGENLSKSNGLDTTETAYESSLST